MESDFKRVAIIGLGLMGGSFGKALRQVYEGLAINTYDISGAVLADMVACQTAAEAVCEADLVVLATPLGVYEEVLKSIGAHLKSGALVMDLGSVKGGLEALCSRCLPQDKHIQWIGGHPMCGSEKSGATHANGDLFRGSSFFLIGAIGVKAEALELENLLKCIGARPIWVTEILHDQTVALTSHLPHLNAAVLMHCTAEKPDASAYIAGGFKDATRVAAGNVQVWKDILLLNKASVLEAIEGYKRQLNTVVQLLETEDSEGLEAYLDLARTLRRKIPCSK